MEIVIKNLENALAEAMARLTGELQTVRSNRPSVGLIEDIKVDYYGQLLPVKQLGSLSLRPPRDIEINVWDKNAVSSVMKGIEGAKMGLSLRNDGNSIWVSLPPLTEERRAEFMKLAKKMVEASRIQVRGFRDEANKKIKALEEGKEIGEDELFKGKEKVQKMVDETNKKIEAELNSKLEELAS